ncbi:MAG: preprotein translocase subunit SecG [Phycisphaerales bacterium]|nr:preprotein translocase subunit SecG [Phycisphaerales bacterium]
MLLAMSGWLLGLSVMGFFLVCLILILTVLIQKPQGGGLSGAFGSSAGSGQTAFGAKTGDALTIFTIAVFVIYIIAAVGLNFALTPKKVDESLPQAGATTTPGATPSTPTPAAPSTTTAPTPETPFGAGPIQIQPTPVQVNPAPTETPAAPATAPAPAEPTPAPANPAPAPSEPAPKPAP